MAVKREKVLVRSGGDELNRRFLELVGELGQPARVTIDWPSLEIERTSIGLPDKPSEVRGLENSSERLIRLKEVLELLPLSKSTWWEGVRTGRFPAPVRYLGPRITAWRLSEVMRLVAGEGQ